jgi:nucleotide-binding universal stress UspA family protein
MAELISLAQAADLIILGQINPDARSAPALRPEKIVVACGRPALLVPYVDIATDLIVAGAYQHSQLREALIGGVSRGLFRHITVPVLMSH